MLLASLLTMTFHLTRPKPACFGERQEAGKARLTCAADLGVVVGLASVEAHGECARAVAVEGGGAAVQWPAPTGSSILYSIL